MKQDPHLFTVEGKGSFPFDMLRFDECWPYEAADGNAMLGDRDEIRRVVLMTCTIGKPTVKRWESFKWKVIDPRMSRRA